MPSHFTHLVFAEEAVTRALGEAGKKIISANGNLLRFGAQGSDFFYHNQRTMPTALRYGVITHRHGYGTLIQNMTREALRHGVSPESELGAFIIGFTTHAPLDRRTHPFIGYFSGWVDPEIPETKRYFRCHPFYERILDVLVLREKGIDRAAFDFLSLIKCGRNLPYQVIKALVKGLNATYPAVSFKSRDRRRVENAYRDTIYFYKLTNHANPDVLMQAYKREKREGFRERRIAFLHPQEIPPGIDFFNTQRATWCHPCDSRDTSTATFMELYAEALSDAIAAVKRVYDTIVGKAPLEGLGDELGNQSLDSGREHCIPVYSKPLPLPELIDSMYAKIDSAVGTEKK